MQNNDQEATPEERKRAGRWIRFNQGAEIRQVKGKVSK